MEAVAGEPTEASKVETRGVITAFTGRTRTVTHPGTALVVVLQGAAHAERVGKTDINGGNGGTRGGQGYNTNHPNQDVQIQQGGGQNNQEGGRPE